MLFRSREQQQGSKRISGTVVLGENAILLDLLAALGLLEYRTVTTSGGKAVLYDWRLEDIRNLDIVVDRSRPGITPATASLWVEKAREIETVQVLKIIKIGGKNGHNGNGKNGKRNSIPPARPSAPPTKTSAQPAK